MSVLFENFTGPSYQLTNKRAAVERLVNWYCTPNETGGQENKYKIALDPSPSNAAFSTLPVPAPFNQPCRGLLELRGVAYGVNGNTVFSIDADGSYTYVGQVVNDGTPCSMVANGTGQIFIASAGSGYVIPDGGGFGSLIPVISGGFLGATVATFQDGYILVITPDSNQFQISGSTTVPLGDATEWNAANVSIQAGQADKLKAIISSREYVRLLGDRRSQVYYNSGGAFPFVSYNETFIETGIAAPFSLVDLGDSIIWVGQDARGQRACWRDAAFSPQRVSNFAIEQQWQQYVRVDDAVAFSYVWKGHLFYRVTFPSAFQSLSGSFISATWEYDAMASTLLGRPTWSERQFLNAQAALVGRPEVFHCFAYGKHLVGSAGGDGNPGAIYQMSDTVYLDCGTDITGAQSQQAVVRDRICPHQWANNKRLIFNRIEFELARGVGLDGNPPVGVDPQILLRMSNDGGYTFGPEQQISAGRIGDVNRRVYFNRCGSGRDRVWWIRCSDPVYWGFIAAEIDASECLV